MILNLLSFACPLILASFGALFSEYAACLALFLEGLISFSAFLHYFFTLWTHSALLASLMTCVTSLVLVLGFSFLTERFKTNKFISAIALNLFFSALPSFLSFVIFGSRGVLASTEYSFSPIYSKTFTLITSLILIIAALLFLLKSPYGLYIRISGSDAQVLQAKGVSPANCRIAAWSLAAFYASFSGIFLAMRISSFVPNIASGRGWMALAAVFLGKKKPLRILICVIIFSCADIFAANIQNFLPAIPTSVLMSFPYLLVLALILFDII